MDDIRDVESLNYYREKVAEGNEDQGWRDILAGSRDHARTPYPWDDQPHAGFSPVTPWIESSSSNRSNHLNAQRADDNSVWHFYRKLIDIRRHHKGLVYGDVKFVKKKKRHYWACYRTYSDKRYFIEANLSDKPIKRPTGKPEGRLIISTHDRQERGLQTYEASIYEL
jgi:oligo-1,6-glucosidase